MDQLSSLSVFVRTVELGSLTAAAQRLGITPSGAGKAITRLEQRLGVRLLHRTTRKLTTTAEGAEYYERCRSILDQLDDAEAVISGAQRRPRGRVVVEAPLVLGRQWLLPLLPTFLAAQPEVALTILLRDQPVDLLQEGVDIAIRTGRLTDSSLRVRRLGSRSWVMCATPGYLASAPELLRPSQLSDHACLVYTGGAGQRPRPWRIQRDGREVEIMVDGRLQSNNLDALVGFVRAGLGVASLPRSLVEIDLAEGRLRCVLDEYKTVPGAVSLVFPPGRRTPARVRALAEFLAANIDV